MSASEIETQKINEQTLRLKFSENGTNYDIIAQIYPKGISCGYICLGREPSLMIISGYDKTAYAFMLKSYISWDYVMEKLVRNGSHADAKSLTTLIHKAQEHFKGVQ